MIWLSKNGTPYVQPAKGYSLPFNIKEALVMWTTALGVEVNRLG